MLPGPFLIIACPRCGHRSTRRTLASGNTLDAVWWSDGKMEAPMLPEQPYIARCPGCGELFWIREAPVLEAVDPFGEDWHRNRERLCKVPELETPGLDEYADALDTAMGAGRDEERYLRIHYWWAANDPARAQQRDEPGRSTTRSRRSRRGTRVQPPAGEVSRGDPAEVWWVPARHAARMPQNLARLFRLLDARRPVDRLLKAEIARQTGKFAQALSLLGKCPRKYGQEAAQLRALCEAGDRLVRPLEEES